MVIRRCANFSCPQGVHFLAHLEDQECCVFSLLVKILSLFARRFLHKRFMVLMCRVFLKKHLLKTMKFGEQKAKGEAMVRLLLISLWCFIILR